MPSGGILEVARAVELLEAVLGLLPAQTVVPEASQAAVGSLEHHRKAHHCEHVHDTVVNDKALLKDGEATRGVIAPK